MMYSNDPKYWRKVMDKKNTDQINGYSRLIVKALHDVVMDDDVFDKLKTVLMLAEELECYMMNLDKKEKFQSGMSNIIQFKRPA